MVAQGGIAAVRRQALYAVTAHFLLAEQRCSGEEQGLAWPSSCRNLPCSMVAQQWAPRGQVCLECSGSVYQLLVSRAVSSACGLPKTNIFGLLLAEHSTNEVLAFCQGF